MYAKGHRIFYLVWSQTLKMSFSILLLASIFRSQTAEAATEYLPQGENKQTMTKQIARELPFIGPQGANDNYYKQMTEGLAALRKEFKDFDKWSSEKPSPITILISKSEEETIKTSVLSRDVLKTISEHVQIRIDEYLAKLSTSKKSLAVENLFDLALNDLIQLAIKPKTGAQGILTGLIQALPPEKRVDIFKAGDPSTQIKMIRNSDLTDASLQASNFKPEVAGLTANNLTVEGVLQEAESRLKEVQTTITALAVFRYISMLNAEDIRSLLTGQKISKTPFQILSGPEGTFLESINSKFMIEIVRLVTEKRPNQVTQFQKAVHTALSQIPRTAFVSTEKKVMVDRPYLKVIEVHPYLGYFRGCVGGDCSTSNSPMFPMSPWEHTFFIQDTEGTFHGYVSATRVVVDGQPTFYLKDISGRNLSYEYAEAVVNSFEKVYAYYGAKKYAIATAKFTQDQNRFEEIVTMLSKYNSHGKEHPLKFVDERIREFIGHEYAIFGSTYEYDSPTIHSKAVFFVPNPNIQKSQKVSFHPGSLTAFKPSTPKESVMLSLNILASDPNASLDDVPRVSESEIKNLFDLIQNKSGFDLIKHYQRLVSAFARYGIELSRTYRHGHDLIFAEGHLRASDALSTKEDSLFSDSERIFANYLRRHGDIELIANFIRKWNRPLSNSKRTKELIGLLMERADPRDIVYLTLFADAGIEEAQRSLNNAIVKSRLPQAIARFIDGRGIQRKTFHNLHQNILSYRLFKFDSLIRQAPEMTSQELNNGIRQILESFALDQNALNEPSLATIFEKAQVQTKDAFSKNLRATNLNRIEKNVIHSPEMMFDVLLTNKGLFKKEAFVESYIESLKTRLSDANLLRLYTLALAGYTKAKEFMVSDVSRASLIRLVSDYGSTIEFSPEASHILKKGRALGVVTEENDFFLRFEKLLNGSQKEKSLQTFYKKFEEITGPYNLTLNDFSSFPQLFSRLRKLHLQFSDAFTSKDEKYLGYTLRFLASNLLLPYPQPDLDDAFFIEEQIRQKFLDNVKRFYNNGEYSNFVRFISRQTEKNCHFCLPLLKEMIQEGAIADLSEIPDIVLQNFLKKNANDLLTILVASELSRRGFEFKFSSYQNHRFALNLLDHYLPRYPHPDLDLPDLILRMLLNKKLDVRNLIHTMVAFLEDTLNLKLAYKATAIYLKNGGKYEDLEYELELVRERYMESSRRRSPETLFWAQQVDALRRNKNAPLREYGSGPRFLSCKKLFNEYTSKK